MPGGARCLRGDCLLPRLKAQEVLTPSFAAGPVVVLDEGLNLTTTWHFLEFKQP